MAATWGQEISKRNRFQFGKNWKLFTHEALNEERIKEAEHSLLTLLGCETISGKRFLDIGCGSGIFSLAAHRLGASVFSFDYDNDSVECTQLLKANFSSGDSDWQVTHGSALDTDFIKSLGTFDIVYSWGVLHHTGNIMKALENTTIPASQNGSLLVISIYNDQGWKSIGWKKVKKAYNRGGASRLIASTAYITYAYASALAIGILRYKNPLGYIRNYSTKRGMSFHHDVIDWLGGYPFEVAKPEAIFQFYKHRGFTLENLITTNSLGCNQFCFAKSC